MALPRAGLHWVNEGLNRFLHGVDQGNEAMRRMGRSASGAGPGMAILTGAVAGITTAITTKMLDAFGRASRAMSKLVKDSVTLAGTFESMEAGLRIAAGDAATEAAEQYGGLGEIALAVGGDTRLLGVSATQAADSITGLLKAGIPLQDVMGDLNSYMEEGAQLGGILRASIDLAAATELDMVRASDLAAVAMSTFNLTAEETNDAMDHIVRAADASVASVSDIEAAMENIGPVASAFGFSIEETNTALGILSTRGIRGSEAGTALKSMLTNLMRQTPKVTEAMEEQGIALYDQEGNMKNLVDIIGQFQIVMEGMTEAERNAFAQTVAGTYGLKALNTLVAEGVPGWADMTEQIAGATGIQEQAATRAETFAGQMEALQGNIETLKIRIGKAFLPTLTRLSSWFSGMVEEHGPKIVSVFQTIGERIGELVNVIIGGGDLGSFFGNLGLDPGWADTIKSVVDGFKELFGVFGKKTDSFDAKFGVGQMGESVGVIRKITDAAKDLLDTIFGTKEPMDARFQMSPGTGDETVTTFDKIIEVVKNVKATFEEVWPKVKQAISTAFGWFMENKETILKVLKGIGIAFAAFKVAATVTPIILSIAGAVSTVVAIIQTGVPIIAAIVAVLGGPVTLIIAGVIALVTALAIAWKTNFLGIRDTVERVTKAIGKTVSKWVDAVVGFFKDLWKKLTGGSIVPDMLNEMKDLFENAIERIRQWVYDWIQKIISFFLNLRNRILTIVTEWLSTLWERVHTKLAEVFNEWRRIWHKLRDLIPEVFGQIVTKVREGVSTIAGKIGDAWNAIKGIGETLVSKMIEGFDASWFLLPLKIGNWFAGLLQDLINSGIIGDMVAIGRSIVDWIMDGISNAWGAFVAWLKDKILGIFGGGGGRDTTPEDSGDYRGNYGTSTSSSAQVAPVTIIQLPQASNVNKSRHVSVEVNPTYEQVQSPATVYHDVLAALAAVSAS